MLLAGTSGHFGSFTSSRSETYGSNGMKLKQEKEKNGGNTVEKNDTDSVSEVGGDREPTEPSTSEKKFFGGVIFREI